MKNGLLTYIITLISALTGGVVVIFLISRVSIGVLNGMNDKYLEQYTHGVRGISSPWYRDGFHLVDEGFIDELRYINSEDTSVVSIGSSLSSVAFRPDEETLKSGVAYRFLVCGNGCYRSDRQLYELYSLLAEDRQSDIIKLEASYSTFRDMEDSITGTVVNKWGAYGFDEDDRVIVKPAVLSPVYEINKLFIKIQNLYEITEDALNQHYRRLIGAEQEEVVPGNFRNNYFNYETVASTCNMSEDMEEAYIELIDDISKNQTLVVELSPLPPGLAETDYGRQFNSYVESTLIPLLNERGIPYLDYRDDYVNEDFCDGVHLGYEGALRYTARLTEDIKEVISDVR